MTFCIASEGAAHRSHAFELEMKHYDCIYQKYFRKKIGFWVISNFACF